MIYEELGTTGIQLSKLSLGGAACGGPTVYGLISHSSYTRFFLFF